MLNHLIERGILSEKKDPTNKNKMSRLLNGRYLEMLVKANRTPIFLGSVQLENTQKTFHYIVPPKTPRGYKPNTINFRDTTNFNFVHKKKPNKIKQLPGNYYMLTTQQHDKLKKMIN